MHRLLERLDQIGGTLVPLAYLTGLLLGTMAYFAGYSGGSVLAVAVGLAAGSEIHSFLQQRRARAAYAEYQRMRAAGAGNLEALQQQLRAQVGILALLVLFQCFTATAYAAETWHPAAGYLPAWLQIGIRGCVIPLLFLLSGFLVPLHESPGAVLQQASQDILHYAVSRNVRHWRQRIRKVHRKGGDLSPLMVALLQEEGEEIAARRTALIAANLQTAEQQIQLRPRFWSRLRGQVRPDSVTGALLGSSAAALSLEAPAVIPDPDPDPSPRGPGPRGGIPAPVAAAAASGPARPVALQLVSTAATAASGTASAGTARRSSSGTRRKGGNTSRAMEENAQLRAQRMTQAREILARNGRISAEALGELIGAPKTVALGIKREIQAEARGARSAATAGQRQTRQQQLQQQQLGA